MTEIVCRSPQQINDDAVVEVHSDAKRLLRQLCDGALLFRGEQRRRLEQTVAMCEDMILGNRPACCTTVTQSLLNALFTR